MDSGTEDIKADWPLKKVRAEVDRLLSDSSLDDYELRDRLSELSRAWAFGSLTWLWGPVLYRRNRTVFRSLIIRCYGTWNYRSFTPIRWKGEVAQSLDPWLAEVDAADDIVLFQRLYQWKHNARWSDRKIRERLLDRFGQADSPAQRQLVLDRFRIWFQMDEPTACALYERDPRLAADFLGSRIPSGGWGEEKRKPWNRLLELAEQRGDEAFRARVYRNRVPVKEWIADVEEACHRYSDPGDLIGWLKAHHPAGWGLKLGDGFVRALQLRGRDVLPWVFEHLGSTGRGLLFDGSFKKIKTLSEENGWWDLWTALIRVAGTDKEFNEAVSEQLKQGDEAEAVRRLGMLAGVSREFNFGGFGLARIHPLKDKLAVDLYRAFPDLVRRPFRAHLQSTSWNRYPDLTREFLHSEDEAMIDFMAGRALTYVRYFAGKKAEDEIDELSRYYEGLKGDPVRFAERAASALAQVPAYTIYNYRKLIQENRLARLLLERSPREYLASGRAMAELVEAQEIHVMALAYRILALDDPRAREAAVDNVDILIGVLLRPLQRKTRLPAFQALINAAETEELAHRILLRAREAMDLPDKKYPKESLVGLIGQLLHRWPQLREPSEQPLIFRHT